MARVPCTVSAVAILAVVLSLTLATPSNATRWNIVLSVVDDMGYADIGYTNSKIHSPTIDALAAGGIELQRHYTYKFCSPSRSMLLAGKWPHRHGQHTDLNMNPVSLLPCALQEGISVLPEVLKENGYKTHMLGKWHLGHFAPKYTPTHRGFDSFYGFYSGAYVPFVEAMG